MCQKARVFVATSAPRMSDVTTDELCVTRSSRLRATRSAIAPPKSDRPMIGTARTTPLSPSRSGEDGSSESSQVGALSDEFCAVAFLARDLAVLGQGRGRAGEEFLRAGGGEADGIEGEVQREGGGRGDDPAEEGVVPAGHRVLHRVGDDE